MDNFRILSKICYFNDTIATCILEMRHYTQTKMLPFHQTNWQNKRWHCTFLQTGDYVESLQFLKIKFEMLCSDDAVLKVYLASGGKKIILCLKKLWFFSPQTLLETLPACCSKHPL